MESYMNDKNIIGGYNVSGIEMLDDNTCAMYFENFAEGDKLIGIVVEYWLNDDSWHFSDNRFAINGYYIDSEDTTHLLDVDKQKCKEFIKGWLRKQKG
jgi:hypothetical protein